MGLGDGPVTSPERTSSWDAVYTTDMGEAGRDRSVQPQRCEVWGQHEYVDVMRAADSRQGAAFRGLTRALLRRRRGATRARRGRRGASVRVLPTGSGVCRCQRRCRRRRMGEIPAVHLLRFHQRDRLRAVLGARRLRLRTAAPIPPDSSPASTTPFLSLGGKGPCTHDTPITPHCLNTVCAASQRRTVPQA